MKKLNLGHRLAFSGAIVFAALLFAFSFFAGPSAAQAQAPVSIDWDAFPDASAPQVGQIITDQYGPASGFLAPFTVTATGGAAGDAVIFDTGNPTGGDFDLGTPNETFGGPGICTVAPCAAAEASNSTALGNVLIVEENSTDDDNDGFIDSGAPNAPDDAVGVAIQLNFAVPVVVESAVVIDQESTEAVTISAFDAVGDPIGTPISAAGLGDNSVETVTLGFAGASTLLFEFDGSGGIESLVVVPLETLAINLGAFNTAADAPYVGLWIAAAAALLSTATIIVRRRSLLNMNHS